MKTIIKVAVCGAVLGLEYIFVRYLDKELIKESNEEANKALQDRLNMLAGVLKNFK